MSVIQIRHRLETILAYMNPFWDFVNCHMVNYLTDNHWDHFIPKNVREHFSNAVPLVDEWIEEVFWTGADVDFTKYSAVSNFLEESKHHCLDNFPEILTSINDLRGILGKAGTEDSVLSIKEFMSEKKRHEVEITAELIDKLILHQSYLKPEKDFFVIDAGDGKGYLSSRLALQYEHKVLGIDFNETNSVNAMQRNQKLQRAWKGLTERAELQCNGLTPPRRGRKKPNNSEVRTSESNSQSNNYKTTSRFITTELNFVQILREFFSFPSDLHPALCLTGLHTCGNLASTCLKVFTTQSDFEILCNIGCCYHLLKEEFSGQEFFGNKEIMDMQTEAGFPMSYFLRDSRVKLGRNARMLAAQSIDRTIHAKERPNLSLFYRALLEVLIVGRDPLLKNTIQVGKIRNFQTFKEYVDLCCKKAELEFFNEKEISNIEAKYAGQAKLLDIFYLLRMTFSPVLESLILLDRLLYLKEKSFEKSFLIPMFDPVISPRHFCIVSLRQ